MCTPYKLNRTTFIKEFCLLKGGTTNFSQIYRHSQRVSMQYNPEIFTCKVNMETHVLLKRDSKYTVEFLIEERILISVLIAWQMLRARIEPFGLL